MELRWVRIEGHVMDRAEVLHFGAGAQAFTMILEYRDGSTHDAPWITVPVFAPER